MEKTEAKVIAEVKRSLQRDLWDYRKRLRVSRKDLTFIRGRRVVLQTFWALVVPTNFSGVNYLNLEHYCEYRVYLPRIKLSIPVEDVKANPLHLELTKQQMETCIDQQYMLYGKSLYDHCKFTNHTIQREYEVHKLIKLINNWDAHQFETLMKNRSHELTCISDINRFTKVLMVKCHDTNFIVKYFINICDCSKTMCQGSMFNKLTCDQLKFFLSHLKTTNLLQFVLQQPWFSEDLILKGLYAGDKELMKLALELNCPSQLLPNSPNWISPSQFCWPRKKDGIMARSFNSCEYYTVLSDTIISCYRKRHLLESKTIQDECLPVIWRALPTPYLSLNDMVISQCCGYLNMRGPVQPEFKKFMKKFFGQGFSGEYVPRSLKHLSRCAIRERCRSSKRIESSPLPEMLKKYVDLEF